MKILKFFFLISSLDKVLSETGDADQFAPVVSVKCVGGTMIITVTTAEPFYGVVHGRNRSEPGCSVEGVGGLKTVMRVDLSIPEGQPGNCGVRYNRNTEERSIGVGVRFHDKIELLVDRLYQVKCGKAGFENSFETISFPQLKVTDNYGVKKTAVLEGSQYTLDLQVLNHDPSYGVLVQSCIAFVSLENKLQLVNDRGCRTTKLLSEFTYNDEEGTASATLYSMFRMPNSNRTYFQCNVEVCKGPCPKPTCDLEKDLIDRRFGSNKELSQVGPGSNDTITTSTSVFVAEPGSAAAVGAGACLAGDLNPTWLTYLCIAFGVLFGIMLLINIFLCSAMTCSCTRTEVIEKEPSIYDDDYSMYDSQYGYASKVYNNSESDYGSDYGGQTMDRSEYSGHNGVSRSRPSSHHGSRYLDQ